MTIFRSSRCARYLALWLVVGLYLLPAAAAPVLAAQAEPPAPRKALVVFPFNVEVKGTPANFGSDFSEAIKISLSGAKEFMVMAFNDRLPPVARAVNDGYLKKEDVAGPFGTEKDQRERAVRLASAMAADLALVGTIDEYQFDEAKKQATVTVTAELIDVKANKSLKTVSVTGRSPQNAKATDEAGYAALAAGDAVTKTAVEITPDAQPFNPNEPQQAAQQIAIQQPTTKNKSAFKKYLLPILLAVGIGVAVAVSNGGSDSGDGGIVTPPQ